MESGAKGCEVVVSGKLRAARAKSMKFTDGFMIHSGQPAKDFIDFATRHVLLRQGVLGIKVKIMRASSSPNDPAGEKAGGQGLPDSVTIIEPKEEQPILAPSSQDYGARPNRPNRLHSKRLPNKHRQKDSRVSSTRWRVDVARCTTVHEIKSGEHKGRRMIYERKRLCEHINVEMTSDFYNPSRSSPCV